MVSQTPSERSKAMGDLWLAILTTSRSLKVNESQMIHSQLQAVYVPGEVLAWPDTTSRPSLDDRPPHPEREASVNIIWRWQTTPISTPLRRKLGSRHTKRVWRQAPDSLSMRRDEYPGTSSTRGTVLYEAAPREEPGKPPPWGLGACNTGPLTRDDLAWSGPSMIGCSRPKQGPDRPASRSSPDNPPQKWAAELELALSSGHSAGGQVHKGGEGERPCGESPTPWNWLKWGFRSPGASVDELLLNVLGARASPKGRTL